MKNTRGAPAPAGTPAPALPAEKGRRIWIRIDENLEATLYAAGLALSVAAGRSLSEPVILRAALLAGAREVTREAPGGGALAVLRLAGLAPPAPVPFRIIGTKKKDAGA